MNKSEVFDNINNLYSKYQNLYEKQRENYAQYKIAFEEGKNNLFLAVLKLYCQTDNSKNWDFIDKITEVIDTSLENFPGDQQKYLNQNNKTLSYSQYVCVKINNSLSEQKSIQIAEGNNGGSSISEHETRMIRTIKKEVEALKNYDLTENEMITEIALRQNIGIKTVRKYMRLAKCNTKSICTENAKESSCLITPEKEFLLNEEKRSNEKLLPRILDAMEKQHDKNDKMESQVLTVHLLKEYKEDKKESVKKGNDFKANYTTVYELLKNYEFIDKEILMLFFEDNNYSLKTDKEIEDENKMTKGAAKHKWDRFVIKMKKENPDIN